MGTEPQVYLGKLLVTGYGWGDGRGHEMGQEEPWGTAGTVSLLCLKAQVLLHLLPEGLPLQFLPLPPIQVCSS